MKTILTSLALIAATVAAVMIYPALKSSANDTAGAAAQRIEVVFVLDTTSSMSGLIETAKDKIWSIATTMAQAEQAPQIHMGLVAYRDRGDAYVTDVLDLSPDLDSMYATLMQYEAAGGGDGPESVNEALHDAVHRISWSRDPSSYKVVFLVGDAPPHMDYAGEAQYPETVRAAAASGIVFNAIQCGEIGQTAQHWRRIASLGNGRYLRVGQSGDAFAVATPYDDEIARLSEQLDGTRLYYGSEDERAGSDGKVAATAALHEGASVAAQARRGVFNTTSAGAGNLFGERDLVDDLESGRARLDAIPAEHLPAPIRELESGEREAAIDEIANRRDALAQRIRSLSEARAEHIDVQVAQTPDAAESLDRQIYEAVREQGARKGLSYDTGPQF